MVVCREGKHIFFVKRYAAVPVVFQLEPKQHVHRSARSGAQRVSCHAVEDYAAIRSILRGNFYEVVVDVFDICFYSFDLRQF